MTLRKLLLSLVSHLHLISSPFTDPFHSHSSSICHLTICPYTALDAISLTTTAKWPLSLILSPPSLTKYQLISRHLIHLKGVEAKLSNAWRTFQNMKEYAGGPAFRPLFLLRQVGNDFYFIFWNSSPLSRTLADCVVAWGLQKIVHFISCLTYHVTAEVIDPLWRDLIANIKKVSSHCITPTTSTFWFGVSHLINVIVRTTGDLIWWCDCSPCHISWHLHQGVFANRVTPAQGTVHSHFLLYNLC